MKRFKCLHNMDTIMQDVPSKETLERLYHKRGLSTTHIANQYNTGSSVVYRWLKAHNIETRNKGEPAPANLDERLKLLRDRSWLKSKLHEEMMHPNDIADQLNYDSTTSVRRWMDKHELTVVYKDKDALRSAIKERWYTADEIASNVGKNKQTIIRWARKFEVKHRPWQYEDVLRELYIEEEKTTNEIGELLGCTGHTVANWLGKFDIDKDRYRYYDKHDENLYGQGWTDCRSTVIERDNGTCSICGETSSDGSVDVHHIDPVRSFEHPQNAHHPKNCICLCRRCHVSVEQNKIKCPEPPQS